MAMPVDPVRRAPDPLRRLGRCERAVLEVGSGGSRRGQEKLRLKRRQRSAQGGERFSGKRLRRLAKGAEQGGKVPLRAHHIGPHAAPAPSFCSGILRGPGLVTRGPESGDPADGSAGVPPSPSWWGFWG